MTSAMGTGRLVIRCLLAMGALLALGAPALIVAAQEDTDDAFDPGAFSVGLEPVAQGFENPLWLTHAGDDSGRWFVLEQAGTVRSVQDGEVLDTPFLDLTDRVGSEGSEQGLLGLAFAPDYAESGLFYVNYTDADGNTVVARFAVTADDPNVADPDSEEVILTQEQPFPNHNGGEVIFGPDGYLYIGFGDGGSRGDPDGNGQSLDTWLGKILRIDVNPANIPDGETYAVPEDNPFVDDPDALPEIWAYGLRNPWRFSFDSETGDFFMGDVGQNQIEEINVVPADELGGQNYGWDITEGTDCYEAEECDTSGFTLPVIEYTHEVGGCSVTGGYVYRGEMFPDLQGVYLYADFCSGNLWGAGQDADGEWVSSDIVETGYGLASFGVDGAGELYAVDHRGGVIYQIVTDSP